MVDTVLDECERIVKGIEREAGVDAGDGGGEPGEGEEEVRVEETEHPG